MLHLSIVIRCGYNYEQLLRCISSIDENVDVVISTAVDSDIAERKFGQNIAVVTHPYGNWSLAAEVGIQKTKYNKIIIMDSDSVFVRKAISTIYNSLSDSVLVVKPTIIFRHTDSRISKLISNIRTYQNEYKPKAFTPGLAVQKGELIKLIGINSNLYDTRIKYADDGNLNKRIYEKKIPIKILKSAKICHSPVSLRHEIKTAYILGKGNKLSDGKIGTKMLIYRELSTKARQFYKGAYKRFGVLTALGLIVWRVIYYIGYFSEHTNPKEQ